MTQGGLTEERYTNKSFQPHNGEYIINHNPYNETQSNNSRINQVA